MRLSNLKMVHNPGGDWNPGQGDNPSYLMCNVEFLLPNKES